MLYDNSNMKQDYKNITVHPNLELAIKADQDIKNVPATRQNNLATKTYNQNQGNPNPSKDSHGPWSPPTDYTFKPSQRHDERAIWADWQWGLFFYFCTLFIGIGFLLFFLRYSDSCPPGLKPKAKTSVTTPS